MTKAIAWAICVAVTPRSPLQREIGDDEEIGLPLPREHWPSHVGRPERPDPRDGDRHAGVGTRRAATQRVPPSDGDRPRDAVQNRVVRSTAAVLDPDPDDGARERVRDPDGALRDCDCPTPGRGSIVADRGLEPAATLQSVPSDGEVTHAASVPTAIHPRRDAGTRARDGRPERSSSRATTSVERRAPDTGGARGDRGDPNCPRSGGVIGPVAASIRTIPSRA